MGDQSSKKVAVGCDRDCKNPFEDPSHLAWLDAQREALLDFYQPNVRLETGGYAYLDNVGQQMEEEGAQLWLGARMLHCFSLAHMLGRPGAAEIVEHGLDFYVDGDGWDSENGGFYATVGGANPSDRKELYGQAQMLLAASSALIAGFDRAPELFERAVDTVERYWREEEGRCVEGYDRTFTELDAYRGQNANMHLTEAYLAAYEASGNPVFLERAKRIATFIAGRAASPEEGAWRLPEHFDDQWEPALDFNRDEPRHPFRPYGSQPGHWLEWSKLILQLRGFGVDEPWMIAAATNLFKGAFQDGWMPDGGFCYTVDWDGTPVVREKYFWETAEAIGAARYLAEEINDPSYAQTYVDLWEWTDQNLIDHVNGGWFPELGEDNEPVVFTWPGKADLYHALQATLYARLPEDKGLAAWAAEQS